MCRLQAASSQQSSAPVPFEKTIPWDIGTVHCPLSEEVLEAHVAAAQGERRQVLPQSGLRLLYEQSDAYV